MSVIASALFLVLTGFLSFNGMLLGGSVSEFIHKFCFSFHLIPYGIAYGGGSELYILLYYTVLWLIIAFAIYILWILIRPIR
ncbi:MAG TPA: hypothetical protein VIN08_07545 [Ohtaekwangia sp.]